MLVIIYTNDPRNTALKLKIVIGAHAVVHVHILHELGDAADLLQHARILAGLRHELEAAGLERADDGR